MPRRDETPSDPPARRSAIAKMFAHDFRNPISALTANVSYLQSEMADTRPDVRGAVDDCAFSLGVLRHLVDNYVLIARLEAGEHIEASPVPLDQFVGSALQASRELVSAAEVELRLEGEVPDEICAFELPYATLVLKNLLVAAAAHAVGSDGGVTLRVTAEGGRARFSVRDSGPLVEEPLRDALLTLDAQLRAKSQRGSRYSRGFGLYAAGLGAAFLGGSTSAGVRDGLFELVAVLPIAPAR